MSTSLYLRSSLALSLCQLFPASIYKSLISDSAFQNNYGLKTDAKITFGNNGGPFKKSVFFNGVRDVLSGNCQDIFLKDVSENDWLLRLIDKGGNHNIELSYGEHKILLPDFSILSPSETDRINRLEHDADEINLPACDIQKWRSILTSGPLSDEALDLFQEDFKDTPVSVAALIEDEFKEGESNLSSLVPRSLKYYERLVGKYSGSQNIEKYSKTSVREHIQQLLSWRTTEGFLFALLLSSHSFNSSKIKIDQIPKEDLIGAYEGLHDDGDFISKLGAIEVGLTVLDKNPEIEPYIRGMIEEIRDDDSGDDKSRFRLLSSLIMLVEGELARSKILREKPPFWRRLASIAQASLIEKCIIRLGVDISHISEWAGEVGKRNFYLQTISDLRTEPRWQPDFLSPRQLKAEFVGRIFSIANHNTTKIKASGLNELLLDDVPESIKSHVEFPLAFLPGPLEGGVESQNKPPAEVLKLIEEQLSEDLLQPKSFYALVNSALIYHIDSSQAQTAAKALRSGKHRLSHASSKEQLFSVLNGLATVAAITRSNELAEEVKILARRCQHEQGLSLTIDQTLLVGLISAAAHVDLKKWCEFIGEWVTEIAFYSQERDQLIKVYSLLETLCNIVPELWVTCGRAEAALRLVVDSR